ncbi:hypothetical protein ACIQVL_03150 [Streptomyces sp. NPDC090499]|uniref:hypothetical protein n=1 Tax=Streptomyces sp. NPDC090499 TaxID=3365965 RepID=UPI0038115824
MEPVSFTAKDIPVLRQAARFLRARELQLPAAAHDKTHQGVLTSALWLDHQADELGAAPQTPSRETRRPIFNHLVAPFVGGPVYHAEAKAMLDAHDAAVRAETLADPEAVRVAAARLDQAEAEAQAADGYPGRKKGVRGRAVHATKACPPDVGDIGACGQFYGSGDAVDLPEGTAVSCAACIKALPRKRAESSPAE